MCLNGQWTRNVNIEQFSNKHWFQSGIALGLCHFVQWLVNPTSKPTSSSQPIKLLHFSITRKCGSWEYHQKCIWHCSKLYYRSTAHLPLLWVRGGVGGQLPKYWYWSPITDLSSKMTMLFDMVQSWYFLNCDCRSATQFFVSAFTL